MDKMLYFFDFASPYAYVGFDATLALAAEAGVAVEFCPAMVWAIFKAQGIPTPLENPARTAYVMADIVRSAAFHGMPYRHPDPLAISAHMAMRMWLGFAAEGAPPIALARAIFAARFADGLDIQNADTLAAIAEREGHEPSRVRVLMADSVWSDALRANIDRAVAMGVPGLPCVALEQELFFGADRLPQLRWRLNLPPSVSP